MVRRDGNRGLSEGDGRADGAGRDEVSVYVDGWRH